MDLLRKHGPTEFVFNYDFVMDNNLIKTIVCISTEARLHGKVFKFLNLFIYYYLETLSVLIIINFVVVI